MRTTVRVIACLAVLIAGVSAVGVCSDGFKYDAAADTCVDIDECAYFEALKVSTASTTMSTSTSTKSSTATTTPTTTPTSAGAPEPSTTTTADSSTTESTTSTSSSLELIFPTNPTTTTPPPLVLSVGRRGVSACVASTSGVVCVLLNSECWCRATTAGATAAQACGYSAGYAGSYYSLNGLFDMPVSRRVVGGTASFAAAVALLSAFQLIPDPVTCTASNNCGGNAARNYCSGNGCTGSSLTTFTNANRWALSGAAPVRCVGLEYELSTAAPATTVPPYFRALVACAAGRSCVNTEGSYKCACGAGKVGDGVACVSSAGDRAPVFTQAVYYVRVAESEFVFDEFGATTAASVPVAINATDADTNMFLGSMTVALNDTHGDLFALSDDGKLWIRGAMDRESVALYELVVIAVNPFLPTSRGIARILVTVTDVDDNAPFFGVTELVWQVSADTRAGTVVGQVTALDADTAGGLVYSGVFSPSRAPFVVNAATGAVTLIGTVTVGTLVGLVVTAMDGADHESTNSVMVSISVVAGTACARGGCLAVDACHAPGVCSADTGLCGVGATLQSASCASFTPCTCASSEALVSGVAWPSTFCGLTAAVACPGDDRAGFATRACSSKGQWGSASLDNCVFMPATTLVAKGALDASDLSQFITVIQAATSTVGLLSAVDVATLFGLIRLATVAVDGSLDVSLNNDTLWAAVEGGDGLLGLSDSVLTASLSAAASLQGYLQATLVVTGLLTAAGAAGDSLSDADATQFAAALANVGAAGTSEWAVTGSQALRSLQGYTVQIQCVVGQSDSGAAVAVLNSVVSDGTLRAELAIGNPVFWATAAGPKVAFGAGTEARFTYEALGNVLAGALQQLAGTLNPGDVVSRVLANIVVGARSGTCDDSAGFAWGPEAGGAAVTLPALVGCGGTPVSWGLLSYRGDPGALFPGGTRASGVTSVSFSLDGATFSVPLQLRLALTSGASGARGAGFACGWWDFVTSSWLTDGCTVDTAASGGGAVTCQCLHTTNFAVLATGGDNVALEALTYAGVAISVPCMLAMAVVFACVARLRTFARFIIGNLCLSLSVALLIFVIGADATGDRAGCRGVAVALHYFLLVAFMWMLLKGVLLWRKFCRVFETLRAPDRYGLYTALAWGLPAVVVTVCAAVWPEYYGSAEVCWLDGNMLLGFLVPVGVVLAINVVFFVLILRVVLTLPDARKMASETAARRTKYGRAFRAALTFMPMMGLTWLFGLLALHKSPAQLTFQYLFTIFCSFQGFFLFVFYFVLDTEVQKWFRQHVLGQNVSSYTTSSSNRAKGKAAVQANKQRQAHSDATSTMTSTSMELSVISTTDDVRSARPDQRPSVLGEYGKKLRPVLFRVETVDVYDPQENADHPDVPPPYVLPSDEGDYELAAHGVSHALRGKFASSTGVDVEEGDYDLASDLTPAVVAAEESDYALASSEFHGSETNDTYDTSTLWTMRDFVSLDDNADFALATSTGPFAPAVPKVASFEEEVPAYRLATPRSPSGSTGLDASRAPSSIFALC